MPKSNKKAQEGGPKPLDKSLLEDVLAEISKERMDAVRAVNEALRARARQDKALNAKYHAEVVALDVAKQDLAGLKRLESRLPAQAYAERKRELESAHKAASEAFDEVKNRSLQALQPYHDAVAQCEARLKTLGDEWNGYERMARAAGVDLDSFWRPGKPLPEDEALAAAFVASQTPPPDPGPDQEIPPAEPAEEVVA